MPTYTCEFCNRSDFKSEGGLKQHHLHSSCYQAFLQQWQLDQDRPPDRKRALDDGIQEHQANDEDTCAVLSPPQPPRKSPQRLRQERPLFAHDMDAITMRMSDMLGDEEQAAVDSSDEDDNDADILAGFDNEDAELEEESSSDLSSTNSDQTKASNPDLPITWIRDQFRDFVTSKQGNMAPLSADEVRAIRLLQVLRIKRAPLNAYDALLEWYLRDIGLLQNHEQLADSTHFIGRETMFKRLADRYNFGNKYPFQRSIKLPSSGAIVNITLHDVGAVIQGLLTDPRHTDSDYSFFGHDPMAPPPETQEYVRDLNTGQAFRETYFKLIDPDKNEQLLPVLIYMDGAAVTHFHNMEVTQVKISLGIFNRKARMKEHTWGIIGYIEQVHEQGGKGREFYRKSKHMDVEDADDSDERSEDVEEMEGVGEHKDQDLHAMLDAIFDGLVEIQERGFYWDLKYRNKIYKDIVYKTFIPFVKADTAEADKLCGKMGVRHGNVKQICRYCHIPFHRSDQHLKKYKAKTVTKIKNLVERGAIEKLRAISQTYLLNSFYKLRFSLGNDRGIHGYVPMDLLHHIHLGIFKYLRDIFFEDIGKTSQKAAQINGISKVFCKAFARQSDRSMPPTSFSKGIQQGKLMGKEYRGVLLIMLALLRTTGSRETLKSTYKKRFSEDHYLDDWILLVELLLQWEAYLNLEQMQVQHVTRLEKKHRYIMYCFRRIAQREGAVGLKLMKFHGILHLADDIIQNGVPSEFDNSPNESHHKTGKLAAKLTQMAPTTFNMQTANRMTEFQMLDLAIQEIEEDRVPWDYLDIPEEVAPNVDVEGEDGAEMAETITTGETQIEVYRSEEDGSACFDILTRSKKKSSTTLNTFAIEFLLGLQDLLSEHLPSGKLPIYTMHKRNGQIFRGHPNFRGKGPWRDWVWVDWGTQGLFASHIWCFVEITDLPDRGGQRFDYGGVRLQNGVYAVVESAYVDEKAESTNKSELMLPIRKETELDEEGYATKRTLYLANTDAFHRPCCVIPDYGGPGNRYWVVKSRGEWSDLFIEWLVKPHHFDDMDPIKGDSSSEEEEGTDSDSEESTTEEASSSAGSD